MSGNELVEVDVSFIKPLTASVHVRCAENKDHFLPYQCIDFDRDFEDLNEGETITLEVQEWLANREELI